jgi:hypothetical protein
MVIRQLSITRGDSQTYNLTFKKADGTPYCIKNWVLFFTVKSNYAFPDSSALFQKIITTFDDTTSGTSGSANINVLPEDTVNATPGVYDYDIAVRTSDNKTLTVMKGKLTIEYDVTNSPGTAGTAP